MRARPEGAASAGTAPSPVRAAGAARRHRGHRGVDTAQPATPMSDSETSTDRAKKG